MPARQLLSLADLGKNDTWLLVQQACGIPNAKARSSFMENMTAVLLFAKEAYPERMCVTAAVRQMGGSVMYIWASGWKAEIATFPREIGHITEYYTDCAILHGLLTSVFCRPPEERTVPVFNAGGPDSRPMQALADVACMYQGNGGSLEDVTLAWVGRPTGTLHSLIEGLEYFPYAIRVTVPDVSSVHPNLMDKIQKAGDRVTLVETPTEAVQGANYICVGKKIKGEIPPHVAETWSITPELLSKASNNAHILLSASPLKCLPIDPDLLKSSASLLYKQAEHRLRVTKRILHWLFNQN